MIKPPVVVLKKDNLTEILQDWEFPFPIYPSFYIRYKGYSTEKYKLMEYRNNIIIYEFVQELVLYHED